MSLLDKTNLLITPNAVKAGKLYSVIPSNGSGDCVVVRNTTATKINAAGFIENVSANTPRLNYLTVGGTPFLLNEPQRTNLLGFSELLTDASFTRARCSVSAFSSITPRNNLASFKLTDTIDNGSHILFKSVNTVLNEKNTFSYFLKKGSLNFAMLAYSAGITQSTIFNLNTGSIHSQGSNVINSTITPFINGWYRCSITFNGDGNALFMRVGTSDGVDSYAGTGSGFIEIFGAQNTVELVNTSYIPTLSNSSVTRNADVITATPPAGTVKITTTFSNDTTQVITSIPALFTVPEGLIKQVLMQNSL